MKKIVIVGSSNTDLIIRVPEIARPGETILGGEFLTFPGGKGANQAVAVARAGGDVIFIASVGDDDYGKAAMKNYKLDGINTENIKICKNIPSGIALITISGKGENAITVAPGANAILFPEDIENAEEAFHLSDYMLVQLETPIETVKKAVELCNVFNTKVILNPAPATELPDELLAGTDIITPNESEAERLTGIKISDIKDAQRASRILHDRGVNIVIITLGSEGAYMSERDSGIHSMVRGFIVNVVDTTAAGDVFNGQLAVALAEGKSLVEAIQLGHAAAALSVQNMGAQSSIPFRKETDLFLKEQRNSKPNTR